MRKMKKIAFLGHGSGRGRFFFFRNYFWTNKKKIFQKLQKNIISGLPHFFFSKMWKNRTFSFFQWGREWDNFWIFGVFWIAPNFLPLKKNHKTSKNGFYDTKQKVDFYVFFEYLLSNNKFVSFEFIEIQKFLFKK